MKQLSKIGFWLVFIILHILTVTHAQEDMTVGNGRIVFVSDRDGQTEIYTMNADGSDVQRLTYRQVLSLDPDWSLDGSKIAFSSFSGDFTPSDIYIMDADGSNLINLTNSPDTGESYPSWSPDGIRIAFTKSIPYGGGSDIYIINVDGTGLMKVAGNETGKAENEMPTWSPDGTEIIFSSTVESTMYETEDEHMIEKVNLTTLTRTFMWWTNFKGDPDWSWANNSIAYHDAEVLNVHIFAMNADGTAIDKITVIADEDNKVHKNPSWSPDGTKMVYEGTIYANPEIDSDTDIYIVDVESGESINITADFDSDDMMPDWQVVPMADD